MSAYHSRDAERPDHTNAPLVERWAVLDFGGGTLLVGYQEGGMVVWLELASFNPGAGWAKLRDGRHVRLGAKAPPGQPRWTDAELENFLRGYVEGLIEAYRLDPR